MELRKAFIYTYTLGQAREFGRGPSGRRVHFEMRAGVIEGERLRGRLVGGGGDWLLAGDDGYWRPDVRAQIETDDGAFVYLSYGGLVEQSAAFVAAAREDRPMAEAYYHRVVIRLETGDGRYAWLNQRIFLGEGTITGTVTGTYDVYGVT